MNNRIYQTLQADLRSALEYMKGDEISISPSLLFALSDLDRRELGEFARVWITLPADRRRRFTQAMAELAEERIEADFNRIFRYLLDDEDPEVRAHAIDGLWEDETPTLVPTFIGALRSDASARVRAAAAEALGRFLLLAETKRVPAADGDEIRNALLATIRNGGEDALVRRRAIESLAYTNDDTVRGIIASAYADEDPKMRATAIFAMGRSSDPYWKRTVAQELYATDPQLRFEAARAVGELEFKAAVPRLIELLEEADVEIQAAAITSLGQIGGKPARTALLAVIASDDEVARELAQDALDELEFANGSDLLLYDLGLTDEGAEQALLEDALDEAEPDEDEDQVDEDAED